MGLQKSLGKWINFLLDLFPSAFVVSVSSFKPYWTKNYAHLLNHGLTSSKMNNKAGYTLGHGCLLLLGPCAFFQFKNEEKAAAKVLKWGSQEHRNQPVIEYIQNISNFWYSKHLFSWSLMLYWIGFGALIAAAQAQFPVREWCLALCWYPLMSGQKLMLRLLFLSPHILSMCKTVDSCVSVSWTAPQHSMFSLKG